MNQPLLSHILEFLLVFQKKRKGYKSITVFLFILMLFGPISGLKAQVTEEQKLLAAAAASISPNAIGENSRLGTSVAIDGEWAIIGAPQADQLQESFVPSGKVLLYRKIGNEWQLQKSLVPSDGATSDRFGYSVSISGDLAIVGAYADDDNGGSSGSAYVYSKDQGGVNNWGEVKKITASDGAPGDQLGWSVSISGDLAIVGAYLDDDNGGSSGSAYVYSKDQGGVNNWGEVKKITASDAASE